MKTTKLRQQIRKILKEEISQTQDEVLMDYLADELIEDPESEDGDVPLSEYFDLEEEGRGAPTKQYVLTGRIEDIGEFLIRANKFITSRESKKLSKKHPSYAKEGNFFTQADIKSILEIINAKNEDGSPKSFTAKDFIGSVARYGTVQPVNAILKVLSTDLIEDKKTAKAVPGKGYITDIYNLKQQEPEEPEEETQLSLFE